MQDENQMTFLAPFIGAFFSAEDQKIVCCRKNNSNLNYSRSVNLAEIVSGKGVNSKR
jgi:hypothetical protein